MCLVKKSLIPKITKTNKIVYKVVLTNKLNGSIYTPCIRVNVKINNTYKGVFRRKREIFYSIFSKKIYSGFIHTWTKLEAAQEYKSYLSEWSGKDTLVRIIGCSIPKNTLYYIGDDNDIATRKLTYIGFVE